MNNECWDGWLVRVKEEQLNPGEALEPMVVLEDRGDRILIQELPQYKPDTRFFLYTESVLKDWVIVIDKNIQKKFLKRGLQNKLNML